MPNAIGPGYPNNPSSVGGSSEPEPADNGASNVGGAGGTAPQTGSGSIVDEIDKTTKEIQDLAPFIPINDYWEAAKKWGDKIANPKPIYGEDGAEGAGGNSGVGGAGGSGYDYGGGGGVSAAGGVGGGDGIDDISPEAEGFEVPKEDYGE